MNLIKSASLFFVFILAINSCNKPIEVAPTQALPYQSSEGNVIGTPVNTSISSNGGSVNIGSAGAKVIIPAGAMASGSTFTIQAIADNIDNEGQGISISGNWTKPITVEFKVPNGEVNPTNYKIALRLNNGYWITCKKPKYNSGTNTVSVRIAPTPTEAAKKGAKVLAKKYDLAFAKTFYIKPDKSEIDLGEKVNLTAWAKEGFVPVKSGDKTFDTEAELEEYLDKFSEASDNLDNTDDDLVPLTMPKGDDLASIPILAKEFQFTNNKDGFTRDWKISPKTGKIDKTGNVGALYAAPTSESDKGKTIEVTFSSKSNKSGKSATAKAKIKIKDNLIRYSGTITLIEKANTSGGRKSLCGPAYLLKETKMTAQVIFTSFPGSIVGTIGFSTYDDLSAGSNDLLNNVNTKVEYANGYDSKGVIQSRLVGSCTASGIYAGSFNLYINTNANTFELKGHLATRPNEFDIEAKDVCSDIWEKEETSFTVHIPNKITGKYTDQNKLSGKFMDKDVEVILDLAKVQK